MSRAGQWGTEAGAQLQWGSKADYTLCSQVQPCLQLQHHLQQSPRQVLHAMKNFSKEPATAVAAVQLCAPMQLQ